MHRHLLRPWLNGLRLLRRPNLHREESTISSFTKPVQQPAENVPRRAVLYVPGNDERKIAKIDRLSKLDCVVLDMEDGVADSKKSEARDLIFKTLSNANFVMQRLQLGQDIAVRINSPLIDEKHSEDDLKAALEGDTIPRSLFVPKVENREMVDWLAAKISAILYDRQDLQEPLRIVLYVESAEGLINMVKILKQATFLGASSEKLFRFDGVVFGSDDFIADIGATRTADAVECLYARQRFVITCKAFRLQAIDQVWINYKDPAGLMRQSEEGRVLGFTGKQVIHPDQIESVQKAFTPQPSEIEWARELIDEFKAHQQTGQGAFTFRDKMVDKPLLLQARNIVSLMETLDKVRKKKV